MPRKGRGAEFADISSGDGEEASISGQPGKMVYAQFGKAIHFQLGNQ